MDRRPLWGAGLIYPWLTMIMEREVCRLISMQIYLQVKADLSSNFQACFFTFLYLLEKLCLTGLTGLGVLLPLSSLTQPSHQFQQTAFLHGDPQLLATESLRGGESTAATSPFPQE